MIGLFALLVRFIILGVFTFGFVVLFEHGTANYGANAATEWRNFVTFAQERASGISPEAPAVAAPAPLAMPEEAPDASPSPTTP